MKIDHLQDAIGQVNDGLITEANKLRQQKRRPRWLRVGAVAAAIAVIVASFFVIQVLHRPNNLLMPGVVALATPQYPVMHKHPSEDLMSGSIEDQEAFDREYDAWEADLMKQRQHHTHEGYQDGVAALAQVANKRLLASDSENRIYSPLNVYLALSLLTETTGGDTQAEILQSLGINSVEKLRNKAEALWNAHYLKDGQTTSLLANSIWFDQSLSINKETLKVLENTYKASAFQGDMKSAAMTKQLQKWLNEQTDNMLESSVNNESFDENTLMALASTILFKAKWANEFNKNDTAKGIFRSPTGQVETDFMSESEGNTYYWGDKFAAVSKELRFAGNMWFFLPDEGVNVSEILDDPQISALLQNRTSYKQQKHLLVNFKVPKFDAMSEITLNKALNDLGIKKVFTTEADFSPINKDADLFVSSAKHVARVTIDEKSVSGAAYTLMLIGAGEPPDEFVNFVLDRPFLFVVQGHDGVPLFIGVVNQP